MYGVDLHAVKARLFGVSRRLAKLAHKGMDLLHRHLPAHQALDPAVFHRGRGDHVPADVAGVADPAEAGGELDENLCSVSVYPLGQAFGGADKAGGAQGRDHVGGHDARLDLIFHKAVPGDDQSDAAAGPDGIVLHRRLGKRAFRVAHTGRADGGHVKAVFKGHPRNPARLKQYAIFFLHRSSSFPVPSAVEAAAAPQILSPF